MNKKIGIGEPKIRPDIIVWATTAENFIVTDDRTGFCYQVSSDDLIAYIKSSNYSEYIRFMNLEPTNVRVLNMILRDCNNDITIFLCSSAKQLIKKICK